MVYFLKLSRELKILTTTYSHLMTIFILNQECCPSQSSDSDEWDTDNSVHLFQKQVNYACCDRDCFLDKFQDVESLKLVSGETIKFNSC